MRERERERPGQLYYTIGTYIVCFQKSDKYQVFVVVVREIWETKTKQNKKVEH